MRFAGKLLAGCAMALLSGAAAIAETKPPLKIGVLDDLSGPYEDVSGKGSVIAAQLAAEDMKEVLGRKVEIVFADHTNKADVGAPIAKRWFDVDGVDMVTGLGNSAVALGVRNVAANAGKIDIVVNAGSSDFSGKFCSPTSFHWVYDTYGLAKTIGTATIRSGAKSFYMILVDYGVANALQRDGTQFATAAGGKSAGSIRVPLNNKDYSSFILQAQGSSADAILLGIAGADLVNFIKQAREFGVSQDKTKMASFLSYINDVRGLGIDAAQGLLLSEAFYWDQDEKSRAFARRFYERAKKMPNGMQAGVYSAVNHYLKAVQAAGTTDTKAVVSKIRELPVNDFMSDNVKVREDGRAARPMYLYQVKKPGEPKGEWDVMTPIQKLSAEEATRPLSESECSFVQKTGAQQGK